MMNMHWQTWITLLLIAGAIVYLAIRWWPRKKAQDAEIGCCGCTGCGRPAPSGASESQSCSGAAEIQK